MGIKGREVGKKYGDRRSCLAWCSRLRWKEFSIQFYNLQHVLPTIKSLLLPHYFTTFYEPIAYTMSYRIGYLRRFLLLMGYCVTCEISIELKLSPVRIISEKAFGFYVRNPDAILDKYDHLTWRIEH